MTTYDAKSAEKTINEEAGLPDNWVPLDKAPIIPSNPTPPMLADGASRYLQGSLPPGFQHDVSFTDTAYRTSKTPTLSLMPLGLQGSPQSNAAITSTSAIVAKAAIAAIPPSTTTGTTGTDTDDGLVHGDAIWETDSAYVCLRDDFFALVSGSAGTPIYGELGWSVGGASNGTFDSGAGLGPQHIGEVHLVNSATSNAVVTQGIAILSLQFPFGPGADSNAACWALLSNPSWKATFIWRFHRSDDNAFNGNTPGPQFTKKSIYVGLGQNVRRPVNGWTRPPIFIGARFDTDTTAPAISDATIKLEAVENALAINGAVVTRDNTQGTVVDTGITPSEDVYYRLEIQCLVAGVVTMSINGAAPSTFTLTKMTINAGTAGTDSIVGKNGQAALFFGSVGGFTVSHPFGPGEPITLSGTGTALDGTFFDNNVVLTGQSSVNSVHYKYAGSNVNQASPGGWSVQGYPSLQPFFLFGNDSQAAPATDTRICIDYFSFVWNPGVGGGTGTPDATKSRYF